MTSTVHNNIIISTHGGKTIGPSSYNSIASSLLPVADNFSILSKLLTIKCFGKPPTNLLNILIAFAYLIGIWYFTFFSEKKIGRDRCVRVINGTVAGSVLDEVFSYKKPTRSKQTIGIRNFFFIRIRITFTL